MEIKAVKFRKDICSYMEALSASGKYICSICGYVYDPAEHDGVAFEDLPCQVVVLTGAGERPKHLMKRG